MRIIEPGPRSACLAYRLVWTLSPGRSWRQEWRVHCVGEYGHAGPHHDVGDCRWDREVA